MLGLNDEIQHEFKPTEGAGDGLTPPGALASSEDSAVIADTDAVPTEVTEELDLLPFLAERELWIKSVENEITEYDKVQEVATEILAAESISRSEIANAFSELNNEALLEQFQEGVTSLAAFTASPTKTNLQEAKQFFRKNLEERKASIDSKLAELQAGEKERFKSLCQTFVTLYDDFSQRFQKLRDKAIAAQAKATASKNGMVLLAEKHTTEGGVKIERKLADIRYMAFNYEIRRVTELLGVSDVVFQETQTMLSEVNNFVRHCACKSISERDTSLSDAFSYLREKKDYEGFVAYNYMTLLSGVITGNFEVTLDFVQFIVKGCLDEELFSTNDPFADAALIIEIIRKMHTVDAVNRRADIIIDAFDAVL